MYNFSMATEKQLKYWESKKGKPSWNKGKKLSPSHKKNLSIAHKDKPWTEKQRKNIPPSLPRGADNKKWRGDDASYYAIHIWVSNHFGKASDFPCAFCEKTGGSKQMQWANLDHKYSRNKKDWIVLCVKCHCNYDQTVLGVKRGGDHSSAQFKERKSLNTNV